MLTHFTIEGFKSFKKLSLDLPRLTVLFGPNASGKSNILDAIQAFSRIGTSRTLVEAMRTPIRGLPIEAFTFPPSGLPGLLSAESAKFSLSGDLRVGKESYQYRIGVGIQPTSGTLSVVDEYLTALNTRGEPRGVADIEVVDSKLNVRRKSRPGRPRREALGQNYAVLSDPRLGAPEYRPLEKVRSELSGWRTYYLDPRVSMREARSPVEVADIGVLGEEIAPFLYRLKADKPKHFDSVRRTLRSLVPSVEDISVDLDKKRGTLDVLVRQDGIDFSSRIVSEGTLRVLALCAIAANPWKGSLIAFEEPENGVHPRRLELIAQLLTSLAAQEDQQLIVTTHSPLFCEAVLHQSRTRPELIALLHVKKTRASTEASVFRVTGPLFSDQEIADGLTSKVEDGRFEALLLRGMLDA